MKITVNLVFITIVTLALTWPVFCQESASYYGKAIGDFMTYAHRAGGSVYAINDQTMWIRNFNYDGTAPDAFLWAGMNSNQPSSDGEIIPKEDGSTDKLGAYTNQNIVVTLMSGRVISDFKWISVWCKSFAVNFADVYITDGFQAPSPHSFGVLGFNPRVHNVRADDVIFVDSKTIRFENLEYDGFGPDAYFWGGTGSPSTSGFAVPDENGSKDQRLRRYTGETITIKLDGDLTVFDIDYIGLWCVAARQNFGHVDIPDRSQLNIPPSYTVDVVEENVVNCEQLNENLQVLWTINSTMVNFQLRGDVDVDEYMAFGISGSTTSTSMVGSDVAVTWFDGQTAQAVDYNINAYSQCSSGIGACPDQSSSNVGINDLTGISGYVEDGVTSISYSRLLDTGDATDKVVPATGETYVSWAIGPINSDGLATRHSVQTEVNSPENGKKINFGRLPFDNCTSLIETGPIEGWDELTIHPNVTHFNATIGPSGGEKGYTSITGNVGWGIAWYINGLLIPRLTLTRGTTYTFSVNGGNDPSRSADYHPLYLTNDTGGGYAAIVPSDQITQDIYAGPVSGPLCQYISTAEDDQSAESDTFQDYANTLELVCNSPGSGTLVFTPDDSTPDKIYYQCYTHRFLGWEIDVIDPVVIGECGAGCLNGGTCVTIDETSFCNCTEGFTGPTCKTILVYCPCAVP
ncbi:protein Skeletor, isoforms B/C-like [Antedon mediterranea]|uniref:protein Skeletor, isoforms B/C-like n=1 Tax=Antedon mediterranea TaxID=105859 RepID=UPI003AF6758C